MRTIENLKVQKFYKVAGRRRKLFEDDGEEQERSKRKQEEQKGAAMDVRAHEKVCLFLLLPAVAMTKWKQGRAEERRWEQEGGARNRWERKGVRRSIRDRRGVGGNRQLRGHESDGVTSQTAQ